MKSLARWVWRSVFFLTSLVVLGDVQLALADSISFGGFITQSTPDGTGPAVNNPSLNNILDGQAYTVVLNFLGSVTSPGTYALTSGSLAFSDPSAPASETRFVAFSCAGQISIACLTITPDGAFDDISLLGCLTTLASCIFGNQLAAFFLVPAASLNSQNVPARRDFPVPFDLLEDDGVTDIQGSVTLYSYTSAASVPEPSMRFLLYAPLTWIGLRLRRARAPAVSSRILWRKFPTGQ